VTVRPYPKSRAGGRTIPIPDFLVRELVAHRELTVGALRRTLGRSSSRRATARHCDGRTFVARSGGQHWPGPGC
jgi:hypothetical protein